MSIQVRSNEPRQTTQVADAALLGAPAEKDDHESAPEADASEQKEASESETEESEEKESDESEEDSEHEQEMKETEEEDKPKKKGGFQRKINKLNARISAKEQEAEYWKQQALNSAGVTKDKPSVETKSPEGKPVPDNFDTHGEYIEALTDWKTEQKMKERDQRLERSRLESEHAKMVTSHSERVKAFSEKKDDFQEVLSDVDDIPVSVAVRDIILSSDNGPELMYELAKNREEYRRICTLPPIAAAREMGKFEARIANDSSEKIEPKKITKAPKPLNPVGTGGKGASAKTIYDPDLSQADYERMRMEQIKKRRQAG